MKKQKAFTLIELLVVIAIIGLLTSIVLVSVKSARKEAEIKKTMAFSSSIQHALGSSAIGMWGFDDNINDSSGNGNNGTWQGGGSPSYVKGIIKKALYLDGSHSVIVPYSEKLDSKSGAVTVEFWVYHKIFKNYSYLIYNYNDSAPLYGLPYWCYTTDAAVLYCFISDTNWNVASLKFDDLKTEEWYHIVITYDGKDKNSIKMFINTKEIVPYENEINSPVSRSGNLYIGREPSGSQLNGMLDELRVYDSYITLSEVKKHYAEGLMKIGLAELK